MHFLHFMFLAGAGGLPTFVFATFLQYPLFLKFYVFFCLLVAFCQCYLLKVSTEFPILLALSFFNILSIAFCNVGHLDVLSGPPLQTNYVEEVVFGLWDVEYVHSSCWLPITWHHLEDPSSYINNKFYSKAKGILIVISKPIARWWFITTQK